MDLMKISNTDLISNLKALVHSERKITHLVTSNSRARTTKVKQAAQRGNIKIVNQQWLVDSMSRWERQNEEDYLVSISIPMEI